MKYQIKLIERAEGKHTRLKTHLSIRDVGYWQRRIQKIVDNLNLANVSVVAVVAKN